MNDCIFCKIVNGDIPSKRIYEDDKVIAILDINPIVDGHTLIIPKKHYNDVLELDDEMVIYLYKVAKELGPKIMNKLGAKAFTYAINYGDSQAVKHVHLHILPDYTIKDSLEKSVDEVYEILKED